MLLYHPEDQKIINWLIQRKEEAGVVERLTDKHVEDLSDCRYDEFRKVYACVTAVRASHTTSAPRKTVCALPKLAPLEKQKTTTH